MTSTRLVKACLIHLEKTAIAVPQAQKSRIGQYRREAPEAFSLADSATALCREHGHAQILAWARSICGWAIVEQGDEAGIDEMRGALDVQRTIGAEISGPALIGLLANGLRSLGRFVEASTEVSEALAVAERTGQHHYEPELHRLRGELLLGRAGDDDAAPRTSTGAPLDSSIATEAEASFRKAIDIARQQQAKSWELRATMSLSRLRQQQGKEEEAHRMLTEVYSWFSEGFDTADLKDAKALLEELSRN